MTMRPIPRLDLMPVDPDFPPLQEWQRRVIAELLYPGSRRYVVDTRRREQSAYFSTPTGPSWVKELFRS